MSQKRNIQTSRSLQYILSIRRQARQAAMLRFRNIEG